MMQDDRDDVMSVGVSSSAIMRALVAFYITPAQI